MAQPMTANQFVDLLDEWHIPHRVNRAGWETHNRRGHGDWGPVNGIGNHHTGGNDDQGGRDVLWNGYGSLPGPLCHAGIQQDGYVLLNGWGRVNHFGLGDSVTLQHVIDEDYTGKLIPHRADVDGNSRFYGFEWMYDGLSEPKIHYPKLYVTAVRVNAAINTWHKWKPLSSICHGEWQPGKWDPGHAKGKMFDPVAFRNDVAQAMKEGPKGPVSHNPPPPPVNPPTRTPIITTINVAKGDTLRSLAKKHLGSENRWVDFVSANPSLLRTLAIGEKLVLPKK